ncbi:kinesin-domain-containing protein [Tilletiaria anomala UBC 951]|uniref:Kinesin-domain-containing protein n=1 Tax=Tilletiaria anomala (strain ATCC 24038 / CBS 436.72 / UBC 951) TaxID=1037660 RepID=A0A066WNA5_TILAU|nr:kinesin-domain-containing protein [Tilletiaria anomala UBC 951]KDN52110.1 kinesin-domain-containing protein [Tilletiaria anomala UBC 951]
MADSGNIKVVVRCRPLNSRERNRGASHLVDVVDSHQLVLNPPNETDTRENAKATKKKPMPFSFDRSFDENTEQHEVFDYVGIELLEHAFNGFNTCVFAYGQTGSGKSHSMVGYAEQKGLIPLTCQRLFDDITSKTAQDPHLKFSVEVSYIEIYNEKVRDLLNPKNKGNLKVREHPSLGPYVEDLSKLVVSSFGGIESLMDEGNKARTVAATNMNETSSRSHAVITLVLTQKRFDPDTKLEAEKVSRISLVDLAGSERANSTGATGARLKEGANINKSLTTLGKVIAALATASMDPPKGAPKKKAAALDNFVPYRDSVLTWLLKDSLGGNSKTAMIAAISPADYEETLSTLRYADQAKKIKNKAVVNEDPNARLIRELKEELEMLRSRVSVGGGGDESSWDPNVPPEKQVVRYQTKSGEIRTVTKAELQEQMEQSEKLMSSLNESWEEKLLKTQEIQKEREQALEELGISVDKGNVGVHTPKTLPHLVNLNEDPLMSECLIYQIKAGKTLVGNLDTNSDAQIRLSGAKILPEHCIFENEEGKVSIRAMPNSMTMVNGKRVSSDEPRRLRSGYRVILGDFHVFRFNHPEEVRRARDKVKSALAVSTGEESSQTLISRPDSPASDQDNTDVDWTYARREAVMAKLKGENVDFEKLNEEELEKLFEDVQRARFSKRGGRPESRMSFVDDAMSESASSNTRPGYQYSVFTDDTSVDQWASEWDNVPSNGLPPNLAPRSPGEIGTPSSVELAKETEILKIKVKEYEEKLAKQTRQQAKIKFGDGNIEYTEAEKQLLKNALGKWRNHKIVHMAEAILAHSALVKEANVISKELGKNTVYQVTVVDDEPLSSLSTGEVIAGLDDFDDVSDPALASSPKPCVAVKVLDFAHSTAYTWSIAKLEDRLQKMRNLYMFLDRPEYSRHFNWADPFYEAVPPGFIFIGQALVPLAPLARRVTSSYRIPLLNQHFHEFKGTCSVQLKFISISANSKQAKNGASSPPSDSSIADASDLDLPLGHKLGLSATVDALEGLNSRYFESVHLQIRQKSFTGDADPGSEVYAAVPTEIRGDASWRDVRLRKTFTISISAAAREHLRAGFAAVELHAKVTPAYLRDVERHDARTSRSPSTITGQIDKTRNGHSDIVQQSRRPEAEMRHEERHDVLAKVQICELGHSGEYEPVAVRCSSSLDPGAFFLRQGSQRRIQIKLRSDSGKQFPWSQVRQLSVGNVRLLDSKGRLHASNAEELKPLTTTAKQQGIIFKEDGTGELTLWAWWDSGMHDTLFLTRVSPAGQRTLLQLSMKVDVDTCLESVQFDMDIAVTINARDAKPPGRFASFIEAAATGARSTVACTAIFSIKLRPLLTKHSKEIWRVDTSDKYVRGQEALRHWRPRSLSLLRDYAATTRKQHLRAEVDAVRSMLIAHPPLSLSDGFAASSEQQEAVQMHVAQQVVNYWKTRVRNTKLPFAAESSGDAAPGDPEISPPAGGKPPVPGPPSDKGKKLTATVQLVPRTDMSARRGWLFIVSNPMNPDLWVKQWCVLKRPYLFIYDDANETEETQVMNLTSIRVEHSTDVERMLERQNVFCLYTAANSWFLQASTSTDLEQWIHALDTFAGVR